MEGQKQEQVPLQMYCFQRYIISNSHYIALNKMKKTAHLSIHRVIKSQVVIIHWLDAVWSMPISPYLEPDSFFGQLSSQVFLRSRALYGTRAKPFGREIRTFVNVIRKNTWNLREVHTWDSVVTWGATFVRGYHSFDVIRYSTRITVTKNKQTKRKMKTGTKWVS